jgi:hypothetical protein
MAYEFLTKLFGTPKEGEQPKAMTAAELVAAIEADKGLSLVNLKDGGYVSEDKYKAKETELKGVQTQLAAANETIKGFEGQDVEGIKKKVSDWETKYNTDTQQLRDQLDAQARAYAEEMFMSGYQFTSKAARNGVLAELRAKGLKVENGTILGGKEFMQGLMDNEDYKGAFVAQKPADDGKGGNEGNEGDGGQQGSQQGFQSTSGNIYTGQNKPKFSAGTNGGVGTGGSEGPKFNFGFTRIREPEQQK